MKKLLTILLLLPALLSAQLQVTRVSIPLANGKTIPAAKYALPGDTVLNRPLFIFLAGRGEQITTNVLNEQQLQDGLTRLINNGNHADLIKNAGIYGFQVIAPLFVQEYNRWMPDFQSGAYVRDVAQWAIKNMNIDPRRITPIGLSSGGCGAFDAVVYSEDIAKRFAGAVPICSGGVSNANWSLPAKLGIDIWAFHSKDDASPAPAIFSINQIAAINSYNPNPKAKLTLYETGGHAGAWQNAFKDQEMYKWALKLFSDSLPATPPAPSRTIIARLFVAGFEVIIYSDKTAEVK